MATEEIEISQLELAEDLAPDMVLPVETTTDTKATTLQKIKEWLGSFFVHKTGNEEISGVKTFVNTINKKGSLGAGGITIFQLNDDLGKGKIASSGYYTAENRVYFRHQCDNKVAQKYAYLDITVDDSGEGAVRIGGNALNITPKIDDKTAQVVTSKWCYDAGGVVIDKKLEDDGYIKYSSRLIIQWGALGIGEREIVFEQPFANKEYKVIPVAFYNSASSIAYYDVETTGCKVYPNRNDYGIKWVAIGKW